MLIITPMKINMAEYMKKRRARRRAILIDMSGGKCDVCNETQFLEFNHRDRKLKCFTLSGRGLDGNWDKILEEHKKCELLCRKHHSEKTRQQYMNGEIVAWNKNLHGEPVHGTARMYSEHACRCQSCRAAKFAYSKKLIGYAEVFGRVA